MTCRHSEGCSGKQKKMYRSKNLSAPRIELRTLSAYVQCKGHVITNYTMRPVSESSHVQIAAISTPPTPPLDQQSLL